MDFEIATFWNVEPLYYVFNAVSATIKSGDYTGLLRLAMYMGLMMAVLWFLTGRQGEFVRWFVTALFFSSIVNLPVARVTIVDRTGYEGPRVVDNVPWTLAASASTFAHIRDWLTDVSETVLSLPDDLKFQGHDIGFAHRIMRASNEVTILSPELRSDVMQFLKECTMYDIRDGVVNPSTLLKNTNSWDYLLDNASPARFVTVKTLSGSPITDTCLNVANGAGAVGSANGIKQRLGLDQQNVIKALGQKFNPQVSNTAVAGSMFAQQLGSAQDFLWSSGGSAAEAIRQSMFNNVWREAGGDLPRMLQDPGAVAAVNAATIATAQSNTAMRAQVIMGEETLPRLHNIIEFILIAMFPVILPLMLVQAPERAIAVLKNYFSSFAWIALWPMLFSVLSFLMTINLSRKAKWIAGIDGIPYSKVGPFNSMLVDDQAMIGSLIWIVPVIAGGIIGLANAAMNGSFSRALGSTQGAANLAGGAAAMGNYQTGVQAHDTMSANMTTAHKFNTDYAAQNGAMSMRMGNGTTVTRYSSAVSTISEAMNSLAMSDSSRTGEKIGSSVNANRGVSADQESFAGAGARNSANMQQYSGHEEGRSNNQNFSTSFRAGDGGGIDGRFGNSQRDSRGAYQNDTYGQQDSTRVHAGASVNASAGVGGGGGGGGGGGPRGAGMGAGIGVNAGVDAGYESSRGRNVGLNRDFVDEQSAQKDQFHRRDGGIDSSYSAGPQSHQSDVVGSRASLDQSIYYEQGKRASVRQSEDLRQSSNRETYQERGSNYDQFRAADLAGRIQERYGVSAFRFAAMSADQKRDLLEGYSAEQQAQNQWTPPQYLDGSNPRLSASAVQGAGQQAEKNIGDGTRSAYGSYSGKGGARGDVSPVQMHSGFAKTVGDRLGNAEDNIDRGQGTLTQSGQETRSMVDPNLDKNKSRTKDVTGRALDDATSLFKDSNDRNIESDYGRKKK